MKYDLSVIIPARNEQFLVNTINDVLAAKRGNTELIVILDGQWNPTPIDSHPDLTIIHHSVSIGQRAATNEGARLSKAKYIMKLDGHCRLDEGFDVKLAANCEYDWTVVPSLYNLHVFDWKCLKCGSQSYQGPEPTYCNICEAKSKFEMVMVWLPRNGKHWACASCWRYVESERRPRACSQCESHTFYKEGDLKNKGRPRTDSMRFDNTLHYQYFREFNDRPGQGNDVPITDTMSLLGACWFLHRDRYWELDGLDERHGSWGQMGTELACKSWLSGGRLVCNKMTWYAHLFRTAPGFHFPYPLSHKQTEHAREHSRKLWMNNAWPKQKHPLSWLVEKFAPVPGWSADDIANLKKAEAEKKQFAPAQVSKVMPQKDGYVKSAPETGLTKGIVYYTENCCPEPLFTAAQKQLARSINEHQLVSVSLKPIDFGDNLVLGMERGYVTMFNQILTGLSHLETDFAFLCEHDCLYPPEHFAFTPPRHDQYFYNENVWRLDAFTGHAWFHYHRSVSGLCADRRLLIDHYRERLARIEKEGFSYRNGFEPGTRSTRHNGYDDFKALSWFSKVPYIDLRHDRNLTKTLRRPEDYRNAKYTAGWTESDRVPGWAVTEGRMAEFIDDVKEGRVSP